MPEPLVLLPGLLCDATSWQPQLAAFAGERPVSVADYGAADTIEDMARAALSGAPDRFALAGHSMGARVALELVRLAPDRVTRLALLDTGIHLRGEGEAERRGALLEIGRCEGMDRLVDAWLPPMVHPARHDDTALMEPLRRMAAALGVEGYARQISALLARPDPRDVLCGLDCPVLIGVGADDRWSPPSQHEEIAALVPHARLVIFPDAGHMAPVEAPDAVNAALRDWLAEPPIAQVDATMRRAG